MQVPTLPTKCAGLRSSSWLLRYSKGISGRPTFCGKLAGVWRVRIHALVNILYNRYIRPTVVIQIHDDVNEAQAELHRTYFVIGVLNIAEAASEIFLSLSNPCLTTMIPSRQTNKKLVGLVNECTLPWVRSV